MGLFDNTANYGYQPGYQYPNYYQYQGPTIGQQLQNTVDSFTRGINDMGNDMNTSFARMRRTMHGEPEYSVARIASWGGGAALLWSIADSSMRNRPEGLLALAVLGVGAVAGNWLYDWFMDRYGQNFGY